MIYELHYSWYDEYHPILFTNTDSYSQDRWESLLDSLLDEAVDNAIAAQEIDNRFSWVGWPEIVEEIAKLLEGKGFVRIQPIKAGYFGSCIIDAEDKDTEKLSSSAIKKLISYHERVRDKIEEEDKNLPPADAT